MVFTFDSGPDSGYDSPLQVTVQVIPNIHWTTQQLFHHFSFRPSVQESHGCLKPRLRSSIHAHDLRQHRGLSLQGVKTAHSES